MNEQLIFDALRLIQDLAALCATQGIEEDTKKMANDGIRKLLSSAISPGITKLSAKGSGLVV